METINTGSGFVKPGFESVRDKFYAAFESGRLHCAQLCVYVGNEVVVDLVNDTTAATNDNNNSPYDEDSLQVVFSSSKVFTAVAVALMVENGYLKYSDRIVDIWPEFGTGSGHDTKDKLTVADLMRHQAGLTRINTKFEIEDFFTENLTKNFVGKVLAEAQMDKAHLEEDGTVRRHYHYFTRGYFANEVCRRADPSGRTIGQILKDSFSNLGIDAHVGLKEGSDVWLRVRNLLVPSIKSIAGMVWNNKATVAKLFRQMVYSYPELVLLPRREAGKAHFQDYFGPLAGVFKPSVCPVTVRDDATKERVTLGPLTIDKFLNSHDYKRAEQPGANGIASARGLAKLAAFLANKGGLEGHGRLMTEATWDVMHDKEVTVPEEELGGFRTQFSQGGVNHFHNYFDDQPMEEKFKVGREGYIGWMGFGGSVCQYHTELKIGFGYAPLDFLYYDPANTTGACLQGGVVKCVKRMQQQS